MTVMNKLQLHILLFLFQIIIVSEWKVTASISGLHLDVIPPDYPGNTIDSNWIVQPVDHFLNGSDSRTWKQLYYYNLEYYGGSDGPLVFLYLGGNEALNSSWTTSVKVVLTKFASNYNAAIYALEHRFYGSSFPFENEKLSVEHLQYLTSRQAIEDAANFIKKVNQRSKDHLKWIVFGGFYGGSLALWLRQKYPKLTIAAVASSPPVAAKMNFHEYMSSVENSLINYDQECAYEIKNSFDQLETLWFSTDGQDKIPNAFGVNGIKMDSNYIASFYYQIVNTFALYFTETSNQTKQLKTMCDTMLDKTVNPVNRLAHVVQGQIFFAGDYAKWFSVSNGDKAWLWQKCNEFGFIESTNGQTGSLFGGVVPSSYLINLCQKVFADGFNGYNMSERVEQTNEYYGGQTQYKGTNAIIIRGNVDPYQSLQSYTITDESVNQYYIPGLRRCADMYRENYIDNPHLIYLRKEINAAITKWIQGSGYQSTADYSGYFINHVKNPSLSELRASNSIVPTALKNGVPPLRYPLPAPSLPSTLKEFPTQFSSGIFNRTMVLNVETKYFFGQRFWSNSEYYQQGGPNFLMLGGMEEASPTWILPGNVPIMELARQFHANVFLLEHRFYGQSIPKGGLTDENLGQLTIDAVLGDIQNFITSINSNHNQQKTKWILFGGSYAGALAAWFRVKDIDNTYTVGAVASSATLQTKVDFSEYLLYIEKALNSYGDCSNQLKKGFNEVFLEAHNSDGRTELSKKFSLQPAWTPESTINMIDLQNFYRNIISVYLFATQYNGSMNDNIKPDGLKIACANVNTVPGSTVGTAYLSMVKHYGNNPYIANDYSELVIVLQDTNASSLLASDRVRLYQMCTELGQFPTTDTGSNIFGMVLPINFYLNLCKDVFGPSFTADYIYRSVRKTLQRYGGKYSYTGTNTVFINNENDPWTDLTCTKENNKNGVYIINVKGGTHCMDMYPSNDQPDHMSTTVQRIALQISSWLNDFSIETTSKRTITEDITSEYLENYDYIYVYNPAPATILSMIAIVLLSIFIILMVALLFQKYTVTQSSEKYFPEKGPITIAA